MAKKLPGGLEEFEASLHDLAYTAELVGRLDDLPWHRFSRDFASLKDALAVVAAAERAATVARKAAVSIADRIWEEAKKRWTIKQLQEATGYDDE